MDGTEYSHSEVLPPPVHTVPKSKPDKCVSSYQVQADELHPEYEGRQVHPHHRYISAHQKNFLHVTVPQGCKSHPAVLH